MATVRESIGFMKNILPDISRTFAFTIPKLPDDLAFDLTIGYAVCRVIDSIEDSPLQPHKKFALMRFFLDALGIPDEPHLKNLEPLLKKVPTSHQGYRKLLDNISELLRVFKSLPNRVQEIILRFSSEMAEGLATTKIQTIKTMKDQNTYCHYAAGVVGYMITTLSNYRGYITDFQKDKLMPLSHSFGLALQKVNIIRDLHQDFAEGRYYWPEEIIKRQGLTYKTLVNPITEEDKRRAMRVLERLLGDARYYLYRALIYVNNLSREPEGLRVFCGDILMMAAATMRTVNTPEFFTSEDKRKIKREEVYIIDKIVNRMTRAQQNFRPFAEHLLIEPAHSFENI